MTNFQILEAIVNKNLTVDGRIKKELQMFSEAPSFIVDSVLKAYQFVILEGNEAQPVNECHSLIAYELGITTMHPGKVSFHYPVAPSALPDIDSDFANNHAVKRYAIEKYGKDYVCNIGTVGRYKFKSLLKDLTRLAKDDQGERLISIQEVNAFTKKLGIKQIEFTDNSDDAEIEDEDGEASDELTFDNEHIIEFQRMYPWVFKHFKNLLGLPKYVGQHAAGILILPETYATTLPIRVTKGEYATEWTEGQGVSELGSMGAIKIDLLGLLTLNILELANSLVVSRHGLNADSPSPCACAEEGIECPTNHKLPFIHRKNLQGDDVTLIDLDSLCLNIPRAFEVIRNGETEGIFQFEPHGITDYAKSYAPTEFADLYYITSLYRPGAMDCHLDKDGMPIDPDLNPTDYAHARGAHVRFVERRHGRDTVTVPAPQLKEILEPSQGIAVFQEDISRIVMAMTGCGFADAEKIRKYFTKVKPELLRTDPATIEYVQKMEDKFVADSEKQGATKEHALAAWNTILPFARYGFNKAHAVSYSLISYQTAFFRAFYPLEFFTSLLTHNVSKEAKVVEYIRTVQKAEMPLKKPDINASEVSFTIDKDDTIVAGLELLKGVGEKAAALIIENRRAVGPFTSIEDFLARDIVWRTVNRKVLNTLAKAGCFDSISPNRAWTLATIQVAKGEKKKADFLVPTEDDIFADDEEPKNKSQISNARNIELVVEDWVDSEKLEYERQIFGFPFEDPVTKNMAAIQAYYVSFERLVKAKHKDATFGIVQDSFTKQDKNGNMMAFITAKDFEGKKHKWVFFASVWGQFGRIVRNNDAYFAFGKADGSSFLIDGIESANKFIDLYDRFNKKTVVS